MGHNSVNAADEVRTRTMLGRTAGDHPPFWHGMVAGATAAVASRVVTYPPDTVKSRLQVQGAGHGASVYAGTADAFLKIVRSEGIPGFYRGFGAILLTVIPANMCYFSGYELGKRITPSGWGPARDLTTATIAQTVAGVVFCPIDIVKQRVQTAVVFENDVNTFIRRGKISPLQAARDVWANQGLRGFYRGYLAMNALWMPWNLVYLTLYESSKRRIYRWQVERLKADETVLSEALPGGVALLRDPPMSQVLPAWSYPLCSSSSAAVAAVVTHPIDVVKTRLQVLSALDKGPNLSAGGVAADLWVAEGFKGFARGAAARVVTLSIGSSMSWFVYEMVKRQLSSNLYN